MSARPNRPPPSICGLGGQDEMSRLAPRCFRAPLCHSSQQCQLQRQSINVAVAVETT